MFTYIVVYFDIGGSLSQYLSKPDSCAAVSPNTVEVKNETTV